MGFKEIIDMLLNPVFSWIFNLPPIVAILILSIVLGLLTTLLQKYMTDQAKMKRLKADTKKYQVQMKELQKKGETEKLMKLQKKMMPLQMDLMKESFRPLFVTMIPFLMIFFWLGNHFAFYPILPNQPFTVTAVFDDEVAGEATLISENLDIEEPTQQVSNGEIKWNVQGSEGLYAMELSFAGASFKRNVLITTDRSYITPVLPLKGTVEEFNVNNQKLTPLGKFSLFGWFPGWIFCYILFSIPISLGLKKVLGVV